MKSVFKIMIIILVCACVSCKDAVGLERPKFNQKKITTEQEARAIAQQYGYNDIDMAKYSALEYMTKSQIEKYFEEQSYYKKVGEEDELFKKELKSIRSVDDYYALIDKYPYVKKSMIKGENEAKFQERMKRRKSEPYHIYVNDSSVVSFIPARLDEIKRGEATSLGKRVDTLKD